MIISRTEPIQTISTQYGQPQALSIRKYSLRMMYVSNVVWFFIMPHVMCVCVIHVSIRRSAIFQFPIAGPFI